MKPDAKKVEINGIQVNREIFEKRFSPCDLSSCKHACCKDGAVIGAERIKRIKSLLPELLPLMRPEAVKAVNSRGFHVDMEFSRLDMDPGHKHYYIRTVKGRCVFLSYDDSGGCVLQKFGRKHNMAEQLKPVGCWAFPFDLIGNRLVMYKWKCLPCLDDKKNSKAPLIYESCRAELTGLLGKEGYKKLTAKAIEMQRSQKG